MQDRRQRAAGARGVGEDVERRSTTLSSPPFTGAWRSAGRRVEDGIHGLQQGGWFPATGRFAATQSPLGFQVSSQAR